VNRKLFAYFLSTFLVFSQADAMAFAPLGPDSLSGGSSKLLLQVKKKKHKHNNNGSDNDSDNSSDTGPDSDQGPPKDAKTTPTPPDTTTKCDVLWGDYCNSLKR
jgi:hypothetical protein